ncbi:pimeloyl-ACP methyl ester carboxylesterase [Actinoalloteichus hoggarensis]|uniref:4,5:9,10-diseco-3-hydroxy-5,9, 17-trioxoandrosta-1(10),2-diene-4-oate hydrolase n=1 Tax=Actinoalloteichus hoggarensis TaxID=1470176 RepID=A0A221VZX5_9PSEU|nr:alpha/beta fold hydrolase [Actinoalloteichus hoggarensis]ASO19067.1 4,5:9,10-diseco-3-hydroxy-5,9,17-trioxoandrosta-1(10),2-diene-4-oate hydrolase [Actinoalloteichus hoggarensis]MBB5920305.1 pimeloyl-ACP methyl ester carboxylesterase [Actinoalloteichus hoggarensis]
MIRTGRASALIALFAVAGVGLAGCGDATSEDAAPSTEASAPSETSTQTEGTGDVRQIDVDGSAVTVSCSGGEADGRPVVVLLHGGGHSLDTMADLQASVAETERVCSYDRLGAGASDAPTEPQTIESSGAVLTAVLDEVAGDTPVVLAGHSLGGLLAARYAPDHQDRVAGLVLMDATSPSQAADLARDVPESATGPAADLREQTLAVIDGENPEMLAFPDADVRSAGDIPVEVVQHGVPYLAEVPEYGAAMEQAWAEGQEKWLAVSSDSTLITAENSGHEIYLDEPEVAVESILRVVDAAAQR